VGASVTGTRGASRAALHREVGAGAQVTRGTAGAPLSQEVGAGTVGTRGAPGAPLSRDVGAEATGTHGALGAALSREVGTGAAETRGAPGAALRREVGPEAQVTRGSPRAALNREAGTTPLPPLPRPSVGGHGMVVPVTLPDNPHRMITRGKTGFRVVPNRLVLTAATSSSTSSLIPSSARDALANPYWRVTMEEEYGAVISNGTWELVP
jgi:hypothetical protein